MFWIVALVWGILGTIIFWIALSVRWSKIDRLTQLTLDSLRVFHPVPGFPGYMDLKFSVLRHAIVFLISSAIVYWVRLEFIVDIILVLNVLYAWSPISRYRYRKRDMEEAKSRPNGEATAHFLSIPIKDSLWAVVFSVLCSLLLFVLFGIRVLCN